MGRTLIVMVFLALGSASALAEQGVQTAKVVAVKKHPQGRVTGWESRVPIYDGYPVYDLTLDWNGKKYVVRYESLTGYFPSAWAAGKEIQVRHERGQFILYRNGEEVTAREVNPNDCVQSSFPPVPTTVLPAVPCE